MIQIDGSLGEGGGQILRSALGLSMVTGQSFTIDKIRAGRKKPGLLRQHLTAVNAAVDIASAQVQGNSIGSTQLVFEPGAITPGDYTFSIGTAGSTTLVLQTILPSLLLTDQPSQIVLEGGTHNPYAPPFDFLSGAFVPVLKKMGCDISIELKRFGFYPAGGGQCIVTINPTGELRPIDLKERGDVIEMKAKAYLSNLPEKIGLRELNVIQNKVSVGQNIEVVMVEQATGPGNVVSMEVVCENVTEVFTGFGEMRKSAERVGHEVAEQTQDYLASEAAIGPYLADQLLIPFALAGGGQFVTMPLTRHTQTNIEIIKEFMDIKIDSAKIQGKQHLVSIHG